MCELVVCTVKGENREKVIGMSGEVDLTQWQSLLEGIFGDSLDVKGKLSEVNIIAQEATIVNWAEFHQSLQ
jgi:hypothetical protein